MTEVLVSMLRTLWIYNKGLMYHLCVAVSVHMQPSAVLQKQTKNIILVKEDVFHTPQGFCRGQNNLFFIFDMMSGHSHCVCGDQNIFS